ncbi:MAG TPA: pteridine reductase [Gammaproteobacteria bacterium]|nr:pteridine reductase [Gammaproteobacteria bacterium]
MENNTAALQGKTVLVTGAARRIGAAIATHLHGCGMNVVLHYHESGTAAEALRDLLQLQRPGSVTLVRADIRDTTVLQELVEAAVRSWGRLDVLVNNASTFYPTVVGETTPLQWDDLMGTNLRAPFFLSQAARPHLAASRGSIVNITDIHASRPLRTHPVYCAAKAGLAMLTRSLARELGPEIRVNAVAPGAILWPEQGLDDATRTRIIDRTALKRAGDPQDIARAVRYLVAEAGYVTGHVLPVDGGRSVGW